MTRDRHVSYTLSASFSGFLKRLRCLEIIIFANYLNLFRAAGRKVLC